MKSDCTSQGDRLPHQKKIVFYKLSLVSQRLASPNSSEQFEFEFTSLLVFTRSLELEFPPLPSPLLELPPLQETRKETIKTVNSQENLRNIEL